MGISKWCPECGRTTNQHSVTPIHRDESEMVHFKERPHVLVCRCGHYRTDEATYPLLSRYLKTTRGAGRTQGRRAMVADLAEATCPHCDSDAIYASSNPRADKFVCAGCDEEFRKLCKDCNTPLREVTIRHTITIEDCPICNEREIEAR